MRRKICIGLALIAGLMLLASESLAHGTGYRHSELKPIALEFMYSTGEKMSYREAKVFSPNDDKFAVHSGRTDEQGRFAFVPDTSGTWRVIVRDEEGHQCIAEVNVTVDFLKGNEDGTQPQEKQGMFAGSELFIRALLGVSIIFNIALIIRRKNAH